MTILRFVATCATLVALATAAQAQQVYRSGKRTASEAIDAVIDTAV